MAEMPSPPVETRRHRSSGVATPPGYRQPMPMIAIGSWPDSSTSRSRRWASRASLMARFRYSRSLVSSVTRSHLPVEPAVHDGEQFVVAGGVEVLAGAVAHGEEVTQHRHCRGPQVRVG